MKINNKFIFEIIYWSNKIQPNDIQGQLQQEYEYYWKCVEQVVAHVKEDHQKIVAEINRPTEYILTTDLQTYVRKVQLMNADGIKQLRSTIMNSSYTEQQKDIYQGIIFNLCEGIREPNKFNKTVHPIGSFSKYAMDRKYKKKLNIDYTMDQLFNGMFNYPTDDNMTYDTNAYRDIITYIKNVAFTASQCHYIKIGGYVSPENITLFQTWPPFIDVVKYQIKYLLFGYNTKYFNELHSYFDPEDIQQVSDIFVSSNLISACVMNHDKLKDLNRLITPLMKENIYKRMKTIIQAQQQSMADKIEQLNKFMESLQM